MTQTPQQTITTPDALSTVVRGHLVFHQSGTSSVSDGVEQDCPNRSFVGKTVPQECSRPDDHPERPDPLGWRPCIILGRHCLCPVQTWVGNSERLWPGPGNVHVQGLRRKCRSRSLRGFVNSTSSQLRAKEEECWGARLFSTSFDPCFNPSRQDHKPCLPRNLPLHHCDGLFTCRDSAS